MSKFFVLLRVCLPSVLLTFTGKGRGKRKRAATGVGAAVLIAALALYISGIYSFAMLEMLAPVGMERLVFMFMGLAALLSGMIFTAFGASATVFGSKDNDLMLSMPVSTTMLMAARVTAIYLENLLLSFFLIVPAGVAYAILVPAGIGRTVGFWLRILAAAAALPLLDTALAVVIGALIVLISAKLPKKTLGKNLMMGLWIVAVFWFSFHLSSGLDTLAVNAESIERSLRWIAPVIWMSHGIMGSGMQLLWFAALSVGAFAAMVIGLGQVYRRAVTASASNAAQSDYRLSNQRSVGQLRALMDKEARRFFGTPVYLWNCGLSVMMLIAAGIAAMVKRGDLMMVLGMPELAGMAMPIVCLLVAFCLSLAAICAPSFSLEGKQMWILRTAPVSERTLIRIKVGFQLLMVLPGLGIALALLIVALEMSAAEAALLCAFSVVLEIALALFGGWLGLALARPEMDEAAVIKRSLLSFLSMFAPMAAVAALAGLSWWIASDMGMMAMVGMTTALLAAAGVVFGALLRVQGPRLLRRLG